MSAGDDILNNNRRYNIDLPDSNSDNITVKCGDILNATTQTIVNTVNCVGVMGKGLAAQFKEKYPGMYNRYKELCSMGKINIGTLYVYSVPDEDKKIVNFPTKDHWKNNSKIEYLIAGLRKFVDKYEEFGISSVAFPMLGCRNGGLKTEIVFPLMCNFLKDINIPVEIWFYQEAPIPVSEPLF